MGSLVDALPTDGEMADQLLENERAIMLSAWGPPQSAEEQARERADDAAFAARIRKFEAWVLSMDEAGHVPAEIMAIWNAHFSPANVSYDGMGEDEDDA